MLVKFLLPKTDQDALEMVVRFKNEGIASLTVDDMHLGFIRQVGEEDDKLMIIADVTEPELVSWIKENLIEGGAIDVVPSVINER